MKELPACEQCPVLSQCSANVIALRPFARSECNAPIQQRALVVREGPVQDSVVACLRQQPGLTRAQLLATLGLSPNSLNCTLGRLAKAGRIEAVPLRRMKYAYYAKEQTA